MGHSVLRNVSSVLLVHSRRSAESVACKVNVLLVDLLTRLTIYFTTDVFRLALHVRQATIPTSANGITGR